MERSPSLSAEEGRSLLGIAAAAVRHGLVRETVIPVDAADFPAPMASVGASFVSLHRDSKLLGCIGTLEPERPLVCDVAANAHRAAFEDPRLPAVTHADVDHMTIEVSVLGAIVALPASSYDDLVDGLEPSVDGLVVSVSGRKATFLPAVWSQLPEPDRFVAALWDKAGLAARAWPRRVAVERYRTLAFEASGSELGTSLSNLKNGA